LKKRRKNFCTLSRAGPTGAAPMDKSFLVLFFKKELLALNEPKPPPITAHRPANVPGNRDKVFRGAAVGDIDQAVVFRCRHKKGGPMGRPCLCAVLDRLA
jgi:hypothetical protein